MERIGIVIIAYNRVKSLNRLLSSLIDAVYLGDKVDLIISIDNSGNEEVFNEAIRFEWPFGEKKIIRHEQRIGLKKHVLSCGKYTDQYRGICILEDDIYVSPAFYTFTKQAINYYIQDENVAGISLYTHLFNYSNDRPFQAIEDGNDVFFMQQAQSWGQIWTKNKWDNFQNWMSINETINFKSNDFPDSIANWPDSSWLKFHNKYIVDNNLFFVYPRVSLTTNFSDVGTNNSLSSNTYQVPLQLDTSKVYSFLAFDNSKAVYNIFFENITLNKSIGTSEKETTIDLYNNHKKPKKFWLTINQNNHFRILKSYGLIMRPHELNVIFNIPGNDIFLYDTSESAENLFQKTNLLKIYLYDTKIALNYQLLKLVIFVFLTKIMQKIRGLVNF